MSTDQAATVVALIREVLSEAVLGIYLHGSSVFGSLKPTSDLDLFVVTSRRTTGGERQDLIERLLPISGPGDPSGGSRSVNFEIVAQSDVRPWRYPARLDFQFGDWYRPDFARGDFAPWNPSNPDLAIVLEMVLQANSPLFGPPPSTFTQDECGQVASGGIRNAEPPDRLRSERTGQGTRRRRLSPLVVAHVTNVPNSGPFGTSTAS